MADAVNLQCKPPPHYHVRGRRALEGKVRSADRTLDWEDVRAEVGFEPWERAGYSYLIQVCEAFYGRVYTIVELLHFQT
jgi:hypothetical protein